MSMIVINMMKFMKITKKLLERYWQGWIDIKELSWKPEEEGER